MAAGDWHEIGGYRFQETLHGPNIERTCVDCGHICYSIPGYLTPRCEVCAQNHRDAMRPVDRMALRIKFPRAR